MSTVEIQLKPDPIMQLINQVSSFLLSQEQLDPLPESLYGMRRQAQEGNLEVILKQHCNPGVDLTDVRALIQVRLDEIQSRLAIPDDQFDYGDEDFDFNL